MVSTVAAERSKLHDQYPRLRLRILDHYDTRAALTGQPVDAKTYQLPRKLGHWGDQHSARVLAACPELAAEVQAIDALRAQRSAELIAAKHVRQQRGPRGGMAKGYVRYRGL